MDERVSSQPSQSSDRVSLLELSFSTESIDVATESPRRRRRRTLIPTTSTQITPVNFIFIHWSISLFLHLHLFTYFSRLLRRFLVISVIQWKNCVLSTWWCLDRVMHLSGSGSYQILKYSQRA